MTKVNREDLLSQLMSVQPGLSSKEIVEQSTCVIFKDKKMLTFNDEIACSYDTKLDLQGAVQAAPLISLLNKLKDDDIELEQTDSELLINGKRRKAGIRMEQEILLPVEAVDRPGKWHDLPEDFADAISIVEYCAAKDETAFALTCVHIHPKWVEATDSYQAARYKLKTGFESSVLVRQSSIKHIVTLGMAKFGETKNWLHFKNPSGLVFSCRRFLDEYRNLSNLFKVEGESVTFPKGIAEAADIANIFSAENKDNQVMVELRPGKLRIKGEGISGWYSEIKKLQYDGEAMKFQIAPDLLIELVKRHNECILSEDRLKVNGGRFVYITSLGTVED